MRMENCPGGNDGNDNDDRGAEVVGGGNGDDDDNENDYNLAQVTGVMRRHGVDCASLARGVKVVNAEIFAMEILPELPFAGGHLEQKPFPLHPLKSQVLRKSRQLEVDRQFEVNRQLE